MQSRPFDFDNYDELLRDPENATIYLAEFLGKRRHGAVSGKALRHVAKAQAGGVKGVAESANLSRVNLYKALSRKGKPQMETVYKTLTALGLHFTITPAQQ